MNVLKKGYAIIEDDNDNIITSKLKLDILNEVNINFHDGKVRCKILK